MAGMRLRTVDAFTERPFTRSPAAVLVLDDLPRMSRWPRSHGRRACLTRGSLIREELPDADFRLRWFTPTVEIDLCGHATLASAHCLLEDGVEGPIRFASRSGVLTVTQLPDGSLAMDFPSWPPTEIKASGALAVALGAPVEWTGRTANEFFLLALLANERSVRDLSPDLAAIKALNASAVIVTAVADPDREYDFVSRLFAPKVGIPEDPVTGAAHTVLAPFWAERLGRVSLVGLQASPRSGLVGVQLNTDRVTITGHAITIFDGTLRPAASPT